MQDKPVSTSIREELLSLGMSEDKVAAIMAEVESASRASLNRE